jgi:putative DNA primase/helicase
VDGKHDALHGEGRGDAPLDASLAYLRAGLSVIPIRPDGSKLPPLSAWKHYQRQLPSEDQVRFWWKGGAKGIAIIGGSVSGNLECIDFDRGELFVPWKDLVEAQAPGLVARLCVVQTPREPAGFHVRYRCSAAEVPGNLKLAQEPGTDSGTGRPCLRTLIETRGEGGYALAPGSPPACHETGRTYDHVAGPALTELADIAAEEREVLIAAARSFDLASAANGRRPASGPPSPGAGLRPGDDFDRRGPDWSEILGSHGWERGPTRGEVIYWKRPGKDTRGYSATTGYCKGKDGADLLAVFSTNAHPFEGPNGTRPCTCYGKFAAHALLNHGGDFKAAARDLARQGYGDQRQRRNGHPQGTAADGQALPPVNEAGALERDDDPHRLARLFLQDHRVPQGLTLRFWREEWHRWDGRAYRKVEEKELRAELVARIKAEFDAIAAARLEAWEAQQDQAPGEGEGKAPAPPRAQPVTTKLVGNVVQALASLAVLPSRVSPPAWIDPPSEVEARRFSPPFPACEILACRNTLLHLPSLAVGRVCRQAHTPAFFSPNAMDYDFVGEAGSPATWLEFLGQLWPDDPQAIGALQEWFGYCLLPDTSQQKILMIVGPKRSGKGTIARVLRALVGIDNTAGPTLAGLGTNFGLWPLLGKTVAIISDARLSGRTDAAVVTERLLSISGEDAQTIDRKNLSHVTCQLPVRFVILTNELPRLSDPSGALVGRLILLRQTRSWYGREDTKLTARLLAELPGILRWSVEGWRRLRERGHFEQPESGSKLVADMEDLSSPIGAFLRECCQLGPQFEILVRDLFERWKSWCEEKGRKDHGSEAVFGRDLRAALPTLDMRQSRADGGRVRVYIGIRLRPGEGEIPD